MGRKPNAEPAARNPDPTKAWRELLGPATRSHVEFMEKLQAHYVETERDDRLKLEVEMMIENAVKRRNLSRPPAAGNRREGTALAIIAESGAGKSTAMEHFLRDNPFFPNYAEPTGGCPLISVQVKAPCTSRQLGMSTLRANGYGARRELLQSEAWPQVRIQLEEQSVLFLDYQEAQRIVQQRNDTERGQLVETLAGLMTDTTWPLYIIFQGLPRLKGLFQDDFLSKSRKRSSETAFDAHVTLTRRTRFVEFAPIDLKANRKDLDEGIKQYSKLGGVNLALLGEPENRARLRHAGARQFGLFWELTVLAIDVCVRAGRKVVTIDDFADAYAARTLQPVELNPFAVDHWASIDTSIIQHRPEDEDDEPDDAPERRREET